MFRRFSVCEKAKQNNKKKDYQKEQITNCEWGQYFIHYLPPFPASIYAPKSVVKEIRIPMTNSKNDGLATEGSKLGKKYPTTLYSPTPLERSSVYLERSLY